MLPGNQRGLNSIIADICDCEQFEQRLPRERRCLGILSRPAFVIRQSRQVLLGHSLIQKTRIFQNEGGTCEIDKEMCLSAQLFIPASVAPAGRHAAAGSHDIFTTYV